ncbi:MAG TPA: hypothetical protein VGR28_08190 [Candidatus Thermoplasmatota archaeon]|jgi:hypothetical protein|nr:hypothetical protein [Candidatus Thermoplasmatota archaeon]
MQRALLVAAMVSVFCVVLLSAEGGAPPTKLGRGVQAWSPRLESWELRGPHDGSGAVVCTWADPCPDALRPQGECLLAMDVWMKSHDVPVVLRDVRILGYAVFQTPTSGETLTFDQPWSKGWWWRAEREHLAVEIPAPCETEFARVTFNVAGVSPWGQPYEDAQTVHLRI